MSDTDRDLLVTKSNRIVEASYMLSLAEQRVLLFCLSRVDSRHEADFNSFKVKINAQDYAKAFDVDRRTAYQQMLDAERRIWERDIIFYDDEENKIKSRWIQSVKYRDGSIELSFAKELEPFLTNLKNKFTTYKFKNIAQLSSVYAIRVYEMLMQWNKSKGTLKIGVDSLKEKLDLTGQSYNKFSNFRNRVLNIAVEQINSNTNLNVSYESLKSGKSISHIVFKFSEKKKQSDSFSLADNDEKVSDSQNVVIQQLLKDSIADLESVQ